MKRNRKAITFILTLALVLCSNTTVFASFWGNLTTNTGSVQTGTGSATETSSPAAPPTATDATENAKILNQLGLYKGTSPENFDPDLGSKLTREQGIALLLRLMGLEAAATQMSDSEANGALAGFTDKSSVSEWAKKSVAYAVKNGLVSGTSDTTLSSGATLTGKQYSTILLRSLGYSPQYNTAPQEYARLGALSPDEASTLFGTSALTRGQAVGISLNTLIMTPSGSTTPVIQKLIDNKVVEAVDVTQISGFGSVVTAPSAVDNTGTGGTGDTGSGTGSSSHHHHDSSNSDTTPPTFTVTAASVTGGDTITLDFSEPMNTNALISVLNAYYAYTPGTGVTLASLGASKVWTDSDTLKITLDESTTSYIPIEAYVGVLIQAQDTAGLYTTSSAVYTSAPVLGEHQGPLLKSWSLTSSALTLTFDEIVDCGSFTTGAITLETAPNHTGVFYTLTADSSVTSTGYSKVVSISVGTMDNSYLIPIVASSPDIYIELPADIRDRLGNPSLALIDSTDAPYIP